MKCTQSGRSVDLPRQRRYARTGSSERPTKSRYKWTSKTQTGWFSFWFNDDGQSFNGKWGYGADTTPVMGRVVGQRPAGGM